MCSVSPFTHSVVVAVFPKEHTRPTHGTGGVPAQSGGQESGWRPAGSLFKVQTGFQFIGSVFLAGR